MLVYQDLLSGDELLSDSFFPYKEIENGMLWEVEGKWVVKDIGANPSAEDEGGEDEGLDDQTVKVVDIIDAFRLQEKPPFEYKMKWQEKPPFDKKELLMFMKRYIKLLSLKLDDEKLELFKKHMEAVTKFLLSKIKDLQFFEGESMEGEGMDGDCSLVFAYYKDGATNYPTFLYLAYGFEGD